MGRVPYSDRAIRKAGETVIGPDLALPDVGMHEKESSVRRLRVKEFAALYGICESTVRVWVRTGSVEFEQPAGKGGAIFVLLTGD